VLARVPAGFVDSVSGGVNDYVTWIVIGPAGLGGILAAIIG
jgi:hypothetical protein